MKSVWVCDVSLGKCESVTEHRTEEGCRKRVGRLLRMASRLSGIDLDLLRCAADIAIDQVDWDQFPGSVAKREEHHWRQCCRDLKLEDLNA